jgi:prepilin-type N-terminal cleavage/methylation domain-containing protein
MVTRPALFLAAEEESDGFTLTELCISLAIFSIVSAGLLMGFTSLERSYAATTAYTINHADQLRLSDYLAMDLRRAVAVQPAQNNTTIFIPRYYDANGVPLKPALDGKGGVFYTATDMAAKTVRTGSGPPSVTLGNNGDYYIEQTPPPPAPEQGEPVHALYGPKTAGVWGNRTLLSVRVHYYLSEGSIYRKQGDAVPTVLAENVQGFIFDVTDTGKVVKTRITFNPRFASSGASSTATTATAFHNTTLLRNTRTDIVSGVY